MPRINFVKHICCCSPSCFLRLQRFLKNLKSEVLPLSKRGSQSCFYRTWKSISLSHQSSTLLRKSCDWSKLQLCYQIETNQVVRKANHSTNFYNITTKLAKIQKANYII